MRLNLVIYKSGYLKIDAFNEEIEENNASHILEYLALQGNILFLSECFRILKKEGHPILETPHLEKSFETEKFDEDANWDLARIHRAPGERKGERISYLKEIFHPI